MATCEHIVTFPDGVPVDETLARFLIHSVQTCIDTSPLTLQFAELRIRHDGQEFCIQAVSEA